MNFSSDALYSALHADLGEVANLDLPDWSVDSSVREVFAFSLRKSLLKKFNQEDLPSKEACRAALEKFLAVNTRCASWKPTFEFTSDEEMVNEVKNQIYNFWFVGGVSPLISDLRECYFEGRAGPGASISARGTDFYTKMFDSPLSSTKGLPELWERCVSMGGLSFEAEASRLSAYGYDVVDSSKYSFVNKTVTVARGICTEPTVNMWFQLGVGRMLERRLSSVYGINFSPLDVNPVEALPEETPVELLRRIRYGINGRDPTLQLMGESPQAVANRWLARAGSIDGSISTIDLESASDSLSLGMLEFMLPRSFMAVLKLFRCASTILPSGSVLDLNMVSTMGNGYTFPLQTMLFSAVVSGVAKYSGIRLTASNFGVFGDDIICPTEITRRVIRVLSILGFCVNSDKTFVEGPFRESCGADFFNGVNVRGVYLKKLQTRQDFFVAINALNYWSARSDISLNRTVTYLAKFAGKFTPVPLDENMDAGIHTPSDAVSFDSKSKNRYGLKRYIAFRPSEYAFYILGGVVWTFRDQVRRSYNPAGLYISLLGGYIRGERVLLRQRRVRYVPRHKWSPRWDYLPPRPLEDLHGLQGYRRFVSAWSRNLLGSGFGLPSFF